MCPVSRQWGFRKTARISTEERVYAISDGEFIKIGKTTRHPQQRLRVMQTGNPRALTLLAWTGALSESQVHRTLRRYRVRGEWFYPAPELMAELAGWDWVDFRALDTVHIPGPSPNPGVPPSP